MRSKPARLESAAAHDFLVARDVSYGYEAKGRAISPVVLAQFNLVITRGEFFCLLGPSGCGKTTVLNLMAGFLTPREGTLTLDGRPITGPGVDRAVVFQSDDSLFTWLRSIDNVAFGPRMTGMPRDQRYAIAREYLRLVNLEGQGEKYPGELSGGMKQRACIAIAICLGPQVIIADEPTSALDVVVQRQVMATLARVQQELGAAVILVGHDMGLMAQFVDRLGIMYAGRLVEIAPIAEIIARPRHPYTRALIAALPSLEQRGALAGIPGLAPSLRELPSGCAFHPRCELATDRCRTERPALRDIAGAQIACHLA